MNAVKDGTAIEILTTHYVDGAFVESHGCEVIDVIRPTDSQVIGRGMLADEEDTRRAIAAARRAFVTWGRSTTGERAQIWRRMHQAASERVDDLTGAMVEEYGGVKQFAQLIVESGVNSFLAAEQALQEMEWGKDDGDLGACWRGRPDYRVEREHAFHLPQVGLGGCRGLHRRHQTQRIKLDTNAGVDRGSP
jgi:acyl-CoA reductase-like NAD-dependent aldehyde dehydrogenase